MVELGLQHPEVGEEFAQYLSARGYRLPATDDAE
jgi:hypothetical protein